MSKLFIPILLGTARDGRRSEAAANFVYQESKKLTDIKTELVDIRDMDLGVATVPPYGPGGTDEKPTPWHETMKRADGLVIVVPEYNHGYPGELKLALDSLYTEFEKKPVGLCAVSLGARGGARMVENLRPVLVAFKAVPTRNTVYFANIKDVFDENGEPRDEKLRDYIAGMFEEVIWYASALKAAREK